MSNENSLFDDDFDLDFDDELETELPDVFEEAVPEPLEAELETELEVELEPPVKETEQVEDALSVAMQTLEGGDQAIPAISAVAFYETPAAAELIGAVASDRRMSRATVTLHEGGLPAAIQYLIDNPTPNLLLLESLAQTEQLVAQIDELASHCDEGVQVMVIGATNDIALYRQLMVRGVSEYLVPPVAPVQVVRAISDLFSDPDAPFVGKSISVIGAKGGVGASTVAHNLAWALSENTMVNTALIDLDLSFGTTALDFNHENAQTVTDALLAPERVDDAVITKLLSKATDRLSLFTAPASVSQVLDDIPDQAYSTVIEGVRRVMPYVVLDLPHAWNSWLYQTLIGSDEIVLICQPDLASLRNGKNMLDKMTADRPNDTPIRLLINMSGVPKRPEIPIKDFAAAMGLEPEVILPFDPQLFGTASNNGQMISETDPQAKPSLAIDHLASLLTGRDVNHVPKSLLKKLLGK